MGSPKRPSAGKVYLIGAGPGDPGLLTLRGRECLELADVVIFDYLVNPELLKHAPSAEKICLGKHGRERIMPQAEVNQLVVQHAKKGELVARLKGGDPAIFARTHQELDYLQENGIPFEIVPGITAAMAVTSTVGIALTHRDCASAVALVTGQGKEGGPPKNIDYQALARFSGTLVFYMGTTTAEHWSTELISAGMDGDTPVVAVRYCSLPQQSSFHCRLAEVGDLVTGPPRLRPPVVFVVGKTAAEFGNYNWFESRPLFGKTILVTRPEGQAGTLAKSLSDLGATVLQQPAIRIQPVEDSLPIEAILARLIDFDWIVFSSVNGVDFFFREIMKVADLRLLNNAKLAVIGPATADRLADYHLHHDLMPTVYEASELARALVSATQGKRVLLIRASRGREILDETLSPQADVTQLVCYESSDVEKSDPEILQRLQQGEIDYVTVTSSAIAKSLVHLFGDKLENAHLASISPVTTESLTQNRLTVTCEAKEYTMNGVVDAILEHSRQSL